MSLKHIVSDALVGAAVAIVLAMVVLILTACSPGHSVSTVETSSISQRAATPLECPTGGVVIVINGSTSPNSVICNGSGGVVGPQGPKGDKGAPGEDLTPISFVQLCQASVGSYPDVFPEVAICVEHKLYGVYSANGGFLVYMPPGAYSSNGINSSCSFTVMADCGIQP